MEIEERRNNPWNQFQEEHKGLNKKELVAKYTEKKEKEKNTGKEPKKITGNKIRIRCKLDLFCEAMKKTLEDEHKKKVILQTPFAKLLSFLKGNISLERDLVYSIVRNFNCEEMTLTVHKGGNTQVFPITAKDFDHIMGIRDGKEPLTEETNELEELDADLLKKYCSLEKNDQYKYINIKKVQEELEKAVDDNVIKQTFALIALHYIVCPTPAGILGKRFLSFVKNANKLNDQPWASIALDSLKHGIQTFSKGKGTEKNLGGCILFLKLYCMDKRMEGLNISEINDDKTKEFHQDWMIDHAPEMKRKKYLAEKICKDLKHISDLIKAKPEKVELGLLLELDKFNEKCKSTISACTRNVDKASTSTIYSHTRNIVEASKSGVIDDYYFDSDIEMLESGQQLNSKHMNFYLKYLERNASPKNGAISDYHLFNTFVYVKLKEAIAENSFNNLRKWCRGDNIFQKEYIVIPVHERSHWSVVIACMQPDKSEPLILHLDSSHGIHVPSQIFKNIGRFMELNEVAKVKGVSIKVPQQKNSSDCGLYVLAFIEHFIKHAPKGTEKEYEKMFEFEDKEVDDLRSRLNSLFMKEREKQKPKARLNQDREDEDEGTEELIDDEVLSNYIRRIQRVGSIGKTKCPHSDAGRNDDSFSSPTHSIMGINSDDAVKLFQPRKSSRIRKSVDRLTLTGKRPAKRKKLKTKGF